MTVDWHNATCGIFNTPPVACDCFLPNYVASEVIVNLATLTSEISVLPELTLGLKGGISRNAVLALLRTRVLQLETTEPWPPWPPDATGKAPKPGKR